MFWAAKLQKKVRTRTQTFTEFVSDLSLGGLMIASSARPLGLSRADNSPRPRSIRDGSTESSFCNTRTRERTTVRTSSRCHPFKPKRLRLFWKKDRVEHTAHLWKCSSGLIKFIDIETAYSSNSQVPLWGRPLCKHLPRLGNLIYFLTKLTRS